ncbi:TnsD family transposase [Ureibacillus chungkukjangi]
MMKMVLWFPTPYPDELLYSVLARYHVRAGNTSPKITTEELFGKRTVRSVWDLPANLNALLKNTGDYWNAEQLILNYTMYPYYAAFLLPQQAKKIKQAMMNDEGSTIHTRIGMAASNVKLKENFWVCSHCIKDDMETYGETYWRRIHQCPGVFFCPTHEVELEETIVSVRDFNQHEYIVATALVKRRKNNMGELKKEEIQLLKAISQSSYSLLTTNYLQKDNNSLRDKYLELLKQNEYATPNGRVKRDRLYSGFKAKFSSRCLELLQSTVEFVEADWLTMIFQKHRKSFHPIRHLLVMSFLDTDLNHLFDKNEYHPFGKGPWLCLNVACSDYRKRVVKDIGVTIDYDTRKPVGTFQCNCGFVYSRKGPDINKEDKFRIGTIKEYGHVWKQKLTEAVNEGKTLTEISREFQADRATIKKYADKLQLNVPWKAPKIVAKIVQNSIEDLENQLQLRKEKWLEIQELYPEKSKTELRKLVPDVYAFLYRNDQDWLNDFSPIKNKIQTPNHRVDWKKRDEELLALLKQAVRNWDFDVEKPTRITATSLGKKINKLSVLEKKSEKLPESMNFINKVSEDLVAFQKRRVEFCIEKLTEEGEPIIEWQIYKKAGLRSNVSNEVKRFISLKVTQYESANNK